MRRITFLAGGLALAAGLSACSSGEPLTGDTSSSTGSDIKGAFTLPDITFTDNDGQKYNLRKDSVGHTTAVFFGFTNCPDVCPTTMADLSQAVRKLDKAERERFRVVFVTADPDRDDPQLLDRWLGSFDSSFTGLTGSIENTDAAAEKLGISIDRPEDRKGDYLVGHGSQTIVFSPEGESELMWRYGTKPTDMVSDVRRLVEDDA